MSEQLTEPAYNFERKFENELISKCLKVFKKEEIDSLLACCFMKNMENLDKASLNCGVMHKSLTSIEELNGTLLILKY